MNVNGLAALPSVEAYRRVLAQLETELPKCQVELLRAHYRFPAHSATACQLAEVVGFENWRAVNLQYGLLGKSLRNALDYHGEGQASYVIASFVAPDKPENNDWLWIMHTELAHALEEIGWV